MSSGSEKWPGNKAWLGNSQRVPGTRNTPAAFRRPFGDQTIARNEFFGAPTGGGVDIVGAGNITSGEAFGQPAISVDIVGAGNIASGEAFGQPTINLVVPAVDIVGAGNIASGEAFGQPVISVNIAGAGNIASGEAFGQPTVNLTALTVDIVGAGNIASDEVFGQPTINLIPQVEPYRIYGFVTRTSSINKEEEGKLRRWQQYYLEQNPVPISQAKTDRKNEFHIRADKLRKEIEFFQKLSEKYRDEFENKQAAQIVTQAAKASKDALNELAFEQTMSVIGQIKAKLEQEMEENDVAFIAAIAMNI